MNKKLKLEYFNIATGIFLCIAGFLYFMQKDYPTALSWGIFGAMYLVMDEYKSEPDKRTPLSLIREVFGVVGFILSLILLVYLFLG